MKDHNWTDACMHARTITLLKRDQNVTVHDYTLTARALSTMDKASRGKMFKVELQKS